MNREMPTLMAASYSSNTISGGDSMAFGAMTQRRIQSDPNIHHLLNQIQPAPQAQKQEPTMSAARIIKIYIADPNENIALEKRVLYTGEEKLTDLTDQELFFEVPIAEMLAKHNEERVKTIDKAQASKFGRDIFLDPAKIRDLKMVVVTVATF